MSSDRLAQLENQTLFILREAAATFKRLGMLWSIGKDSTVLLHLARKAFFGRVPFPLLHVDTSFKIPEMITFRDQTVAKLQLQLWVAQNLEAIGQGQTFPDGKLSRIDCCRELKTRPLQALINGEGKIATFNHQSQSLETISHPGALDAVILGIRGDEEGSRSKERVVSLRGRDGRWEVSAQPPELWHFYANRLANGNTARIHPLINWTELDVWEYIEQEKIEVVSLYFDDGTGHRYRSLGCAPCSAAIVSEARTVSDIVAELRDGALSRISERAGRAQDKEGDGGLEKLRRGGYM